MDNLDPIEQKALELAGHSNGFVSKCWSVSFVGGEASFFGSHRL
jgi:hypothetical protein